MLGWDLLSIWRAKRVACGKLSYRVYLRLYFEALGSADGRVVEIGPAQGASTIALALGAVRAGKSEKLMTVDRFEKSLSLNSTNDVESNMAILKRNVRLFGVEDQVEIVAVVDDTRRGYPSLTADSVGLLFIDADGAVDRDIAVLYSALQPRATIIFDDYSPVLSPLARRKYLRFSPESEAAYLRHRSAQSLRELTPLGKSVTVFRLVNVLVSKGLLEVRGLTGNTLFTRAPLIKPSQAIVEEAMQECQRARTRIYGEFQSLRESSGHSEADLTDP